MRSEIQKEEAIQMPCWRERYVKMKPKIAMPRWAEKGTGWEKAWEKTWEDLLRLKPAVEGKKQNTTLNTEIAEGLLKEMLEDLREQLLLAFAKLEDKILEDKDVKYLEVKFQYAEDLVNSVKDKDLIKQFVFLKNKFIDLKCRHTSNS